jgi:hypothetical protein
LTLVLVAAAALLFLEPRAASAAQQEPYECYVIDCGGGPQVCAYVDGHPFGFYCFQRQ